MLTMRLLTKREAILCVVGSWWVGGSWGSVCVCVCVCVRWAYSLGIHKDLYRAQELTVVDP